MQTIHILAVEDNPGDYVLLEKIISEIKTFPKKVTNATSLADSLNQLKEKKYDVVLLNLSLPDSYGLATFTSIYTKHPEIPTIILSGLSESEIAIQAIQAGAQDYLVKGEINSRLVEKTITGSIARKKAENDILFKSAILSAVRESIIVTDFTGRIIYWNDGAKIKLGYDSEEVLGKLISIIYKDPIKEKDLIQSLKQIAEGNDYKTEFHARRKDGSCVWLEVRTRAINDLYGKPIGLIGVSRSIENRKNAELQVKKSEANLKAIFNNTYQAFVLIDRNYQILFFNKIANEICNNLLNKQLYEGELFIELISDFPVEIFKSNFNNTLNGNKLRLENKLQGPDKKEVWLETYFIPVIDDNEECVGVAISSLDITQRKKDEKKIKEQNEELQKTNAELDSFVYSTSHDLKAPLSAILGIINVAIIDPVESSKDLYLGMIEKNVKRLLNVIKDFTNYSRNARIEIGAKKIKFQPIIEEIINSFQYLVNTKFISYNISVDLKEDFISDKRRLKILFNNLISNAIIFHNTKQKNPYINISVKSTDTGIEIIVEDNGFGIEENSITKIFEMFYRASTNSQGSGIGLYIVKSIVEKLNGSIQVESKTLKGTKFIIQLVSSG